MDLAFIIWFASVVLGVIIGAKKGEGCISFIMCFLLGPLWLPVVILSKGKRKKCEYCKEYIDKDATVCPHCRRSQTIIINK